MACLKLPFLVFSVVILADLGHLFLLDRSSYTGNGESKFVVVFLITLV